MLNSNKFDLYNHTIPYDLAPNGVPFDQNQSEKYNYNPICSLNYISGFRRNFSGA